ncbi:YraN family protein [Hwanghaeella sp.]|uniref:YraN family protein n=1 Tax=Hwanghaeella sp. TaxID=2605943 RepID=UPI003CCB9779
MSEDRKRAERRGRWAETLALIVLLGKGYRPVARRLKTPVGELDLVMRRGQVLAVVEVKARPSLDQAAEAIRPRQWQRLARAVEWLIAGRPGLAALSIRFDAVLVSGLSVRHVTDAWRP